MSIYNLKFCFILTLLYKNLLNNLNWLYAIHIINFRINTWNITINIKDYIKFELLYTYIYIEYRYIRTFNSDMKCVLKFIGSEIDKSILIRQNRYIFRTKHFLFFMVTYLFSKVCPKLLIYGNYLSYPPFYYWNE